MECALLAGGEAALQRGGGRRGAFDLRVADSVRVVHLSGPHVDELPLQVLHDPGGRQPFGVPGEAHAQPGRHEPQQPAGGQVAAREALEPPRPVPALAVHHGRGRLGAEEQAGHRLPLEPPDLGQAEISQRPLRAVDSRQRRDEPDVPALRRRRLPYLLGEGDVPSPPGGRCWDLLGGRLRATGTGAGHEVDEDLERRVESVQQAPEACHPAPPVLLGGVEVADRPRRQHTGRRLAHPRQLSRWERVHECGAHAAGGRSDASGSGSRPGPLPGSALIAERRTITAGHSPLDWTRRRRPRRRTPTW